MQINEREEVIRLLKVIADPTRFLILDMLMTGMHCNCEIAKSTGLSMSLISHHLRILTDSGLIESERNSKDGRWIYYSVNHDRIIFLRELLDHFLDLKRLKERAPSCPTD
jgi:ArsR family transcriptional regulator